MKFYIFAIICSSLLIMSGCTKKESTYKQYDLNGIMITENTGVPADSTFKIELREVAYIDNGAETDPER